MSNTQRIPWRAHASLRVRAGHAQHLLLRIAEGRFTALKLLADVIVDITATVLIGTTKAGRKKV